MADQGPVKLPDIKPGVLIWGGRFRNRPAIITNVYKDDKGKIKYEMTPIPQGRKHTKVRNLFPFAIMTPEDSAKYLQIHEAEKLERAKTASVVVARFLSNDLQSYLMGYMERYPHLFQKMPKIVSKGNGFGEARQHGKEIWIFPKFFEHDENTKDWILTHELGHYLLNDNLRDLQKLASDLKIDLWDSGTLPYGQPNMEEAFADSFASYHLSKSELKSRYPKWLQIVEALT